MSTSTTFKLPASLDLAGILFGILGAITFFIVAGMLYYYFLRLRHENAVKKKATCAWICVSVTIAVLITLTTLILVAYSGCWTVPLSSARYPPPSIVKQPAAAIARASRGEVVFLSFNLFLRMPMATDSITAAQDDYKDERLDDFINTLDNYDILALQESWLFGNSTRKKRLLTAARLNGLVYFVRSSCPPVGIWPRRLADGMLLILSRHPFAGTDELFFADGAGSDSYAAKGALFARVFINGNASCDLNVYNTHLQAGSKEDMWTIRKKQLAQLSSFIARTSVLGVDISQSNASSASNVLGGDMNTDFANVTRTSEMLRILATDHIDWLDLKGIRYPNGSVTCSGPLVGPHFQSGETCSLDYILWHQGNNNIRANLDSTEIEHFYTPVGTAYRSLSDHYGVKTTLNIDCT